MMTTVALTLLWLPLTPAADGAPTTEQLRFFESKVRPILVEHCHQCHGPQKQRGGLRLDTRAGLLQGGDGGAVIVPGKPEQSRLIDAVRHGSLQMPPGGKLKEADIEALTTWVRMGAPWPTESQQTSVARRTRSQITDEDRAWWAFRPVRPVAVPPVADNGWCRNEIDRFILHRLQAEGLSPAPPAEPRALVRRIYFDLIGLPPSPEEMERAVRLDPNELVNELLDIRHYGERWARHWLDLVRYADSDGYRIDDYRPHAWRYRDYVIKAFNEDKPYDRFVQEQLAGDELFADDPEALIATGYLRHWIYEYNLRDVRGQWDTILNDITDTTGDVFFGLGLQCARCHDHKFDPILQKDYYRLRAFFAAILPRDDLVAATPAEVEAHRRQLAVWEAKTADIRRQIDAIEARYRAVAEREAVNKFPEDIQEMIRKPVSERSPLEHQLAELAYRQVYYEYDRLDRRLKGADKEKVLALRKQLAEFDKDKPEPLPIALAVTDTGPVAPPVFIPKKGNEPIEPGFLTVLDEKPAVIEPVPGAPHSTGRRAALARWLTRPDNPLTARVIVNRVWQYHFGQGLAANSSDFGRLGEQPSHPELLDWLAGWFVREGWSLKKLHRLILDSATYRQSTRHPQFEQCRLKDPLNRLYWRGHSRRLDAEQIRDAILAVTGELDLKPGGPGVPSVEPRRTIYTRVMRNTRDPLLDVFDLPLFFSSTSSRDTTTTPVQSLLLVNSQGMLLRARAMAQRIEKEVGPLGAGATAHVDRAYRLAFGRPPSPQEIAEAVRFLNDQARRIDPKEAGSAEAAFLYDKIPYRDGQAAVLTPDGPQSRFEVPHRDDMVTGDFTIEAFILLRSIYDSGAVRTVAAKWDGNPKSPGWHFGVTGKQSRRKPQTLVLQLFGKKRDGSFGEEAIFSDQHIQLNKPYYVAAAVKLADDQPGSVTFHVKDLSNDDEPLLTARVPHKIVGGCDNQLPFTIGGRATKERGAFDGLVDDVRLSGTALDVGQLLFTNERVHRQTIGWWPFEPKPDVFHDATGHGLNIRPGPRSRSQADPLRAAFADFCQALLTCSEFLYVE
ncbi:MAG: DUF1553 domain-containing protein [Gemmataceae bacterium]|nr:DUF1553 domain-containing protein [Gemmataceae bacterium]MDW8264829.1 DUF1553 domain-containing protein [Gemmataceae bacterium]